MSEGWQKILSRAGGKPVAVLGGGRSGQAAGLLLRKKGLETILYDEDTGAGRAEFSVTGHELFVSSPGFRPDHPWVRRIEQAGKLLLGEISLAAQCWPGRLLAVTGTNGKSTLTEFLTALLQAAGKQATAVGNIGLPFAEVAARETVSVNHWAVCEVSSFQAASLQGFHPEVVFWTNFAPDHLAWHGSEEAYFAAKWRLVQNTLAGGGRGYAGTSVLAALEKMNGRDRLPCALKLVEAESASAPTESLFARPPQNENYALAAAWWKEEGEEEEVLQKTAQNFLPLPHRLEFLGECGGIRFWDDSKATNFAAVEAALEGFADPVLWIGGGQDKGDCVAELVKRIYKKVKVAALLGETSSRLAKSFAETGVSVQECAGMDDAVRFCLSLADSGDHLILSPGFASQDQYQGFAARGKAFRGALANQLSNENYKRMNPPTPNHS
ncbi:MAG: UDP-N-acetylmuramoyl-L-alanine--D-glutamate ligase [Opitutales bacterium]|nr:UDP-N-acetylmuramoyl-L-alanine--D-glutamate ligase [Opitutales bacterium]